MWSRHGRAYLPGKEKEVAGSAGLISWEAGRNSNCPQLNQEASICVMPTICLPTFHEVSLPRGKVWRHFTHCIYPATNLWPV